MELTNIYQALSDIPGFNKKIAYRAFPEGAAPALPYITYLQTYTHNFAASNKVLLPIRHIQVELYTAQKDISSESAVESCFDNLEIVWDKTEIYLDTERMYQIIYDIEI